MKKKIYIYIYNYMSASDYQAFQKVVSICSKNVQIIASERWFYVCNAKIIRFFTFRKCGINQVPATWTCRSPHCSARLSSWREDPKLEKMNLKLLHKNWNFDDLDAKIWKTACKLGFKSVKTTWNSENVVSTKNWILGCCTKIEKIEF